MIEATMYTNPKALNLDTARTSTKKVTLGFTCEPELKIKLAEQAYEMETTLSRYVEELVSEEYSIRRKYENLIKSKIELNNSITKLKNRINLYENESLHILFNQFKDQTITYNSANGQSTSLKINDISDIYTIIINSFKTSK